MLDRVTDPRNLGAVCRSAEGAGATGVVVPAHGSAVVTPAVARSSAGAVEHLPIAVVTNLARYLEEVKGAGPLGVRRGRRGRRPSMWEADLAGGVALVFGAEGKGLRPLVRRTCDVLVSIPLAGAVESLNVSVAAALLLYEARARSVADATLYLFDGYNLLHAGPFADRRELVDALASFVATRARAASSSSTASATTSSAGRSRCASRRTPTRCSSGSRPSTATGSGCCSSRRTRPCSDGRGREVAKLSSQTFFRDLRPPAQPRRRLPAGSPASSTRRRARGSNGSAGASERVHCKWGLCSLRVLASFTSTSG